MIRFHDPWGRIRSDVDADVILAAIAEGGPTFWDGPAGQSALSFGDDKDALWLFLTRLPNGRFFLYGRRGIGPTLYLAGGPGGEETSVTVDIGGAPVIVPARYQNPAKEAARIAAHFIESGDLAPGAAWVPEGGGS